MKPDVRKVLSAWALSIPEHRVAVLLSGGIDSASILFALLDAGKDVDAYSFALAGYPSTDFLAARALARSLGIGFRPVYLPRDLAILKRDVVRLTREIGARSKTAVECFWPMLYAYPETAETVVASGMGADGHFCISKRGMIHFRDRIDEFRRGLYANPDYAQAPLHHAFAASLGKRAEMPYLSDAMRAEFLGTSWRSINTPHQKQAILDAYPEQFVRMRVRPHTNLQLGDSGIAEQFEALLRSDWNPRNQARSVVALYNAARDGRLG
jgi:asparagine synthetase B (glutamine-hydrolysing)